MNKITHHIHSDLLQKYALGDVDYAVSLVIASHISLCDECRAELETFDVVSAEILLDDEPQTPSADLEHNILEALEQSSQARPSAKAPYPQPVMEALGGKEPKWQSLGAGVKQHIISYDKKSSVRLLHIEAGKAVPEHSHKGDELTLVLQGAFGDKTGDFARGDVETANAELDHQPIAKAGEPCICLAATSDRLVFHAILPRIFQTVFRI